MSRIRTVKPDYWASAQIMDLSVPARLLFIGMWNFCDDAGIHPASARTLKALVFPGDDFDVVPWVQELLDQGLIVEYEARGKGYWHVTGWHHQKIDKPSYKYPLPNGSIPRNFKSKDEPAERYENVRRQFD
jgi:hypothetical protein